MNTLFNSMSASLDKLMSRLDEWIDQAVLFLPNILLALIIAVVSFFVSKYIRKVALKSIARFTQNKTVLSFSSNLVSVLFSVLVLFIILSVLNLDGTINKILATAGVLGLAVGLALQDPMNNLFSGVFMSVRKLYKIGDLVETNGYFGYITNIDLRATKIRLPSGEEVVIPNKKVIQNPLKNYVSSGVRRVDIPVGVHYDDDLKKVEEIAKRAIEDIDQVDRQKPVEVIFTEFGDSSINLTVRYWLHDPSLKDYLFARSSGIKKIKKAFDEAEITIPFPIRTLDFNGQREFQVRTLSGNTMSSKEN